MELCGPWPTDPGCPPGPAGDSTDRAVKVASDLLWRLTGKVFGVCPATVRPCRVSCAQLESASGPPWYPLLDNGVWRNIPCGGGCVSACSCTEVCEVALPGPVASITVVRLDGAVIPSNEYRVDNGDRLVRLGEKCWPTCQDMTKPDTEPNTWSVTYLRGTPVPEGGELAVSLLAREVLKACAGSNGCQLPARVREITRQGMTMTVLGDLKELDEGLTGIPMVDMWIRSVNPTKRRSQPWVYSPDLPASRSTTWTAP